jgi:acetyltransferase-like isoleucine patch superfamily enzyme
VLVIGGKPTTHGRRLIRQQPENSAEGAVTIGDGVHIAPFTILSGIGGLSIGNNCKIGSHVSIYTFSQVTARPNVLYLATMRIGDDAVIGTNSSLICLTEVEAGTVVKPNSFLSETLLSKAGHAG